MAKMTKTQKRNSLASIHDKAFKLLGQGVLTVNDFESIKKVVVRNLNKL
tara:strand:- start:132 stop:278 length:147 start_codon:yes stop_codon:yes gene_type:complete